MAHDEDITYHIVLENDKSIKQFLERFYIIPKKTEYTKIQSDFLKANAIYPQDPSVREGRNGFIVFRGRKKKILTEEQCREIRESNLTQMELSKQYKVSIGTINKVKHNKY